MYLRVLRGLKQFKKVEQMLSAITKKIYICTLIYTSTALIYSVHVRYSKDVDQTIVSVSDTQTQHW